jgi:hypothetical protein
MAKKIRWQAEQVIDGKRVYARMSRSEIVVRVENDGDTTKYAEWGMPKVLGLIPAMRQAVLQTNPDDIRA